jgi:hypothetical protein
VTCGTNPIQPGQQASRVGGEPKCVKRTQLGRSAAAPKGEMRKTKPIPHYYADREIGVPGEGRCAKRSQFPGRAGRDEASGTWDMSRMCDIALMARFGKRPQFHASAKTAENEICKTKPIGPSSGRAGTPVGKDGKRSQFLTTPGGAGLRDVGQGQNVQNEAIARSGAPRRYRVCSRRGGSEARRRRPAIPLVRMASISRVSSGVKS